MRMIEAGDNVPAVPVRLVAADGVTETTSDAVLGDGLVVLFTVPGAFTPTCHVNHLPGVLANIGKLQTAGVERVVCAAVNDHHVLKAWADATGAVGRIDFIADPHAALAAAMGLLRDFGDLGMRFRRSAMIFRDGIAQAVFVEEQPGVNVSGAPAVLMALAGASA
jgi:peroxiredoxin